MKKKIFNKNCPICDCISPFFKWNDYYVYKCGKCGLLFSDLSLKEVGGNSSPVDSNGISFMADSFFRTKDIANSFAIKRKNIYEKILKRKCKSILEIGCGPGVFYDSYNNISVNWTGIEINPFWIQFGIENNIPIQSTKLSKIKGKFDVIASHQVLEHIENPNKFMDEIKSKLNPGGLIHFELPNQNSLTSKLRQISPKISYDFGFIQPPMHLRAYNHKSLRYFFDKHGLNTIKIKTCGNNHKIWGQARIYSIPKKLIYSLSELIGLGSLLVGLAVKK